MKDQILELMSKVTKKSVAELTENFEEKGLWDSFTHIELTMAIEEQFDIMFEQDEIAEMLTPKSVIETVNQKVDA